MTLPRMLPKPKRRDNRIRSQAHLKWVRRHGCCVPCCPEHRIEAAHVRNGTDGGTSLKPGDDNVIALCWWHHRQQHEIGEAAFEKFYQIDMKALAREFWQRSPHRRAAEGRRT